MGFPRKWPRRWIWLTASPPTHCGPSPELGSCVLFSLLCPHPLSLLYIFFFPQFHLIPLIYSIIHPFIYLVHLCSTY